MVSAFSHIGKKKKEERMKTPPTLHFKDPVITHKMELDSLKGKNLFTKHKKRILLSRRCMKTNCLAVLHHFKGVMHNFVPLQRELYNTASNRGVCCLDPRVAG